MRSARTSASVLSLALLFCSAATAVAQTPVQAGQTVSGRLTNLSRTAEDRSFYDLYTYEGRRGERVRVTMRSSDFDAYLSFGRVGSNGAFERIASNDDGAGGTDALVEVTLPADGTYAIRANTLSAGNVGAYTLAVSMGSAAVQTIRTGQSVAGRLSGSDPRLADESHYTRWMFEGRAGQQVTAILRSNDFDAYLSLGRMEGGSFQSIASDDDGAGGTDARVSATLPSTGTYTLQVNTVLGGETGAYALELASGVASLTSSSNGSSSGSDGASLHPRARSIRVGQTVSGSLSDRDPATFDGTYYQDWIYSGKRGDRIVVTLRSSAFDAYLQFGRAQDGTFQYITAQDDGAGGNDSLLATTLPADGDYVLRVNTLQMGTGAYTLSVETLSNR